MEVNWPHWNAYSPTYEYSTILKVPVLHKLKLTPSVLIFTIPPSGRCHVPIDTLSLVEYVMLTISFIAMHVLISVPPSMAYLKLLSIYDNSRKLIKRAI